MADPTTTTAADGDERVLEGFGYRPQLKRTLKPWAVFGIAFSFMSITTSVYTSYGYGLGKFGPASVLLWPAVLAGQLLVALIIAELGSRIPLAGYSYQWGGRLVNTGYGWLIAVFALAYLLASAATITYVLVAPFIAAMLGWDASRFDLLLIAFGTLAFTAVINIVGVRLFARINSVAVACEIVAALVIAVVVAVAYFVKPDHPVSFLASDGGIHGGSAVWAGIVGAMAMGLFSLTGFESAADISEEAVGATGSVPRAVIYSLVGSGVVGFISLLCFALATPDISGIANSSSPVVAIIAHWLGGTASRVLIVFPLFAVLGTALAVIAVQGRLLFALARDNVAPGSGLLRRVNHAKTPAPAIVVGTLLSAALLVYAYFQASAFNVLVGATSILPYVVYLMLIAAYVARRRELTRQAAPGTFALGRWAVPVFGLAFLWLIGALLMLTVPGSFHSADVVVGIVAAIGVAWYGAVLHWRVRAGRAGVATLAVTGEAVERAPAPAGARSTVPDPGAVAVDGLDGE
jgi:amino acid transporter